MTTDRKIDRIAKKFLLYLFSAIVLMVVLVVAFDYDSVAANSNSGSSSNESSDVRYSSLKEVEEIEDEVDDNSDSGSSSNDSSDVRYSSLEAEQFMQKTCKNTNQTLMKKKTVYIDGTKIYIFMSVAENGMTCISTVSEIKLEVINVDCGETQIKINQWKNYKTRFSSLAVEQFMQKTCKNTNQTLMKKHTKTVYIDGTKIYIFMSAAENGMTCVSTVSEIKLEVINVDCGETQIKINQWKAMQDGARF